MSVLLSQSDQPTWTSSNLKSAGRAESEELVIAFVGPVGVDLDRAEQAVMRRLKEYGYKIEIIKITRHVLPQCDERAGKEFPSDFSRISTMMDVGNDARKRSNNGILAWGVAAEIARRREPGTGSRTAYLIHSLKHPAEVRQLREIYSHGFFLISVQSSTPRRRAFLVRNRRMNKEQAKQLMQRDRSEKEDYGQKLNATFHLADFFLRWGPDEPTRLDMSVNRFIDLLFGHPYTTPTFSEYAMFLAFSASLRSADLSRQVGAVVTSDSEVLATGANDCPAYGGGLYWPKYSPGSLRMEDFPDGRDYKRGVDANRHYQLEMMRELYKRCRELGLERKTLTALVEILKESSIKDLTEFGRIVHAEMAALLACARHGIATKGASLYCTTFPCHNCAKHIIGAGIRRVVFIEPYEKSKAIEFHKEALEIYYPEEQEASLIEKKQDKVRFEPFIGVGPRRFFDFFSMELGSGEPLVRKDRKSGKVVDWPPKTAQLRSKPTVDRQRSFEAEAAQRFLAWIKHGVAPKN